MQQIESNIEPPFVGQSRILLVDGLLRIFDEIAENKETRWVSLEAPSGWGKTRIAQELYKRLAGRQANAYWPQSILAASYANKLDVASRRKRVFPEPASFDRAAGALPEFMWWGIACDLRNGLPSQTLIEDLEQLKAHAPYLEAAWSALAAFREKRFPTLKAARAALGELLDEASGEALEKIVELIASQSIPGMGLIVSLGKWGFGKAQQSKKQREAVESAGAVIQVKSDDIVDDTVSMLSRLARPGLPAMVFIEDLHRATPLVEELVERLVRSNASILVLTSSWPGELDEVDRFKRLFDEQVVGSRILRVRHDRSVPDCFPVGASLEKLPSDALKEIVYSYFPKADSHTVEKLAARYQNPLPLELFCTLPKFQKRFKDGALTLPDAEINALPNRVEDLYRELWAELPESVQRALALATLAIPDREAVWHNKIVQQAVASLHEIENVDDIARVFANDRIPHGWARVVESWLRSFNEPDQLYIAKEYVDDHFFAEEIDQYRESLARELVSLPLDGLDRESQYRAWLRLALHAEGKIDDQGALEAVSTLQQALAGNVRDWPTITEISEILDCLNVPDKLTKLFDCREIHARVLGMLGRVEEALEQSDVLLQDQRRILGDDHPDVLVTRNNIASWLAESGRVEAALEQFDALLRDQRRILGDGHPHVLVTRNNIAFWQGESGRVGEALEQFDALLRDQRRILGDDHPDVLTTRNNIASWLGRSGRGEAALEQFDALLRDQRRILGDDHPHGLITRNNIASWLGRSGRVGEALEQFDALLRDQRRILGDDHPDVLTTRNNIAFWQGESGRGEAALEQFDALLRDQRRILGGDHPGVLVTRYNIAYWLAESGRLGEALEQSDALLRDHRRILGDGHPHVLVTRNNIASWLAESGRVGEALEQFDAVLMDMRRILGDDNPNVLTTRNNISFWLAESGRVAEAIKQSEALLQDRRRVLGDDHPDVETTKTWIAELKADLEND